MRYKKSKVWKMSRKATFTGLMLMGLVLSGLFGCSKSEEYTVAVANMEDAAQTATGEGTDKDAAQTAAGEGTDKDAAQTAAGEGTVEAEADEKAYAEQATIYADISGAVCQPGVYELPADARVFEGIEAAGGLLPEACTRSLNQAQVLTDGQKIYVPTFEEWESLGMSENLSDGTTAVLQAGMSSQTTAAGLEDGLININTADEEELCELPGVGESRAQAIILYREEHGAFRNIEEIQNVSGIKSGLFAKIKDLIKVN